jgi:hypothetical protein
MIKLLKAVTGDKHPDAHSRALPAITPFDFGYIDGNDRETICNGCAFMLSSVTASFGINCINKNPFQPSKQSSTHVLTSPAQS